GFHELLYGENRQQRVNFFMSPHGKKHHFEVFVHPFEPGLQTRSKLEFSRIVTEEHTVDVVIENGLHVQPPPVFSLSWTNHATKEYHKKSEDKDRHSTCVIRGFNFLSCALDAPGRGNSTIQFAVSMDCFWKTKLEEMERQLLATTSLFIPGD